MHDRKRYLLGYWSLPSPPDIRDDAYSGIAEIWICWSANASWQRCTTHVHKIVLEALTKNQASQLIVRRRRTHHGLNIYWTQLFRVGIETVTWRNPTHFVPTSIIIWVAFRHDVAEALQGSLRTENRICWDKRYSKRLHDNDVHAIWSRIGGVMSSWDIPVVYFCTR